MVIREAFWERRVSTLSESVQAFRNLIGIAALKVNT